MCIYEGSIQDIKLLNPLYTIKTQPPKYNLLLKPTK